MLDLPSVVRLREGLNDTARAIAAGSHTIDHGLQERVCAVVDDLRALGWPPERVIVAVKQVAEDAGVRGSRNVLRVSGGLTGADQILQNIVRWCIEHYYRSVPPS